jgi:hypothetical protein
MVAQSLGACSCRTSSHVVHAGVMASWHDFKVL